MNIQNGEKVKSKIGRFLPSGSHRARFRTQISNPFYCNACRFFGIYVAETEGLGLAKLLAKVILATMLDSIVLTRVEVISASVMDPCGLSPTVSIEMPIVECRQSVAAKLSRSNN